MDIAEKTLQLKKDFDDVYDKALDVGHQIGYDFGYTQGKADGRNEGYMDGYSQSESDFWDVVQKSGKRTNVEYMFAQWDSEYIRPKYKVVANSSNRTIAMFRHCRKLKKIEKEYFDLSAYTPVTTASSGDSNYQTFLYCDKLEEIEDIGIQGGGYYYTYNNCQKLHTIEVMRCVIKGEYTAVFTSCNALKNITIEGEIGKNFDIHYSPLSTESIVSIIEHLSDTSGATLTLNTNAVNSMVFPYTSPYTNITYNSWDELIATKTNWTISKASA